MEAQLTRLGEAYDNTVDAYGDGLKYLESMNFIFQRVMNDSLSGAVRCINDLPSTYPEAPARVGFPYRIDFQSYIQEYWLCMSFADFTTDCRRIWDEAHPVEKVVPLVVSPETGGDTVIIFGGG